MKTYININIGENVIEVYNLEKCKMFKLVQGGFSRPIRIKAIEMVLGPLL